MMAKREKHAIYFFFLIIYILMAVYNYSRSSQWIIDNISAIALLTLVFVVNKWLKMGKAGFVLFNAALLTHNLGTFGFYSWRFGFLAYDNLVHFLSAFVAAYIAFNFIARKLHIKKNQRVKHTVVDEHKLIFIFLVFSTVAMLGAIVELIEFFGFMFLGPGEGILFTGVGDSDNIEDVAGQYTDTMGDIIVNTIGAFAGVLVYYYTKYEKQPWIRY